MLLPKILVGYWAIYEAFPASVVLESVEIFGIYESTMR
jgi:hypothetical protein